MRIRPLLSLVMRGSRPASPSAAWTPRADSRSRPQWSEHVRPGGGARATSPEVGARPQFRYRNIQRAGAGVELAVAVAVAHVDPLRARFAIGGATDGVGLGRHQGVDEGGQHLPQQVRRRGRQLVVQETGRVDTARSGNRVSRFLKHCERSPEDHVVAALPAYATPLTRACRTPLWWTPLQHQPRLLPSPRV